MCHYNFHLKIRKGLGLLITPILSCENIFENIIIYFSPPNLKTKSKSKPNLKTNDVMIISVCDFHFILKCSIKGRAEIYGLEYLETKNNLFNEIQNIFLHF